MEKLLTSDDKAWGEKRTRSLVSARVLRASRPIGNKLYLSFVSRYLYLEVVLAPFLFASCIVVDLSNLLGSVVHGNFHCRKSEDNSRELDVEIHYSVVESEGMTCTDTIVQMYKVR